MCSQTRRCFKIFFWGGVDISACSILRSFLLIFLRLKKQHPILKAPENITKPMEPTAFSRWKFLQVKPARSLAQLAKANIHDVYI